MGTGGGDSAGQATGRRCDRGPGTARRDGRPPCRPSSGRRQRALGAAAVDRIRAARGEHASRRADSSGEGSSPFEHDALARGRRPMPGVEASSAWVYGCSGRAKMRSFGPCSIARPEVHHQHVVRDVADHGQVVRDEEIGEAELALQVGEQIQHLRLHRDVERRHRLVGHDQRRVRASARARSRCAGAGRPRTCADSGRSARAAGRPWRASRARARRAAAGGEVGVDRERRLQDRADLLARIERAVGVLEHHLHRLAQLALLAPADVSTASTPASSSVAADGGSISATTRASVDLPQPDSPTTASVRPASMREGHAADRLQMRRLAQQPAADLVDLRRSRASTTGAVVG